MSTVVLHKQKLTASDKSAKNRSLRGVVSSFTRVKIFPVDGRCGSFDDAFDGRIVELTLFSPLFEDTSDNVNYQQRGGDGSQGENRVKSPAPLGGKSLLFSSKTSPLGDSLLRLSDDI